MITPVIIAGGQGSRLWPVSRQSAPKPFVPLTGGAETLLQSTLRRLAALTNASPPLIVCNAAHETLARQQARQICDDDPVFLLEPEGRNTAPAICAAALLLQQRGGDEPMLVLPADHRIGDEPAFADAVTRAAALARDGHLVTFATTPDHAATGYGYLKLGKEIDAAQRQFCVASFIEKPDAVRAAQFIRDGGYAWNSGMFMFRPSAILEAFAKHQPQILAVCRAALTTGTARLGEVFAQAPSISIDNAIMEQAENVATVSADLDWNDLGDWQAMWQTLPHDRQGNALNGPVLPLDSHDSLLLSDGPQLVAIGLTGMIAIAANGAVLVAPLSRAQEVKDIASLLGKDQASGNQVEQIRIAPQASAMLISQSNGHLICITGRGIVTSRGGSITIKTNQSLATFAGDSLRIENPSKEILHLVILGTCSVER